MTSRDGILILLGMPQSGASFLAETVAALGMTLPDDAAATAPFEPPAVQRLNDALLTRKGAWWGRIAPLRGQVAIVNRAEVDMRVSLDEQDLGVLRVGRDLVTPPMPAGTYRLVAAPVGWKRAAPQAQGRAEASRPASCRS